MLQNWSIAGTIVALSSQIGRKHLLGWKLNPQYKVAALKNIISADGEGKRRNRNETGKD